MKVINIINAKGGVGKTTTALNLAVGLADLGNKVLLIDSDPQGNATISIDFENKGSELDINNVLQNTNEITECIYHTEFENMDILPSFNMELISTDKIVFTSVNRESKLAKQLRKVRKIYDFVIIDNAPTFNTITANTLNCGDDVIIPMTDTHLSECGKQQTLMQLAELGSEDCLDKQFNIKILFTMIHRGNRPKTDEFIKNTKTANDVFDTTIGYQDGVIKDYEINKKVVIRTADKKKKVGYDYQEFVKEFVKEND